jgi:hypothetical protein
LLTLNFEARRRRWSPTIFEYLDRSFFETKLIFEPSAKSGTKCFNLAKFYTQKKHYHSSSRSGCCSEISKMNLFACLCVQFEVQNDEI